jgi:hypothetical protein
MVLKKQKIIWTIKDPLEIERPFGELILWPEHQQGRSKP